MGIQTLRAVDLQMEVPYFHDSVIDSLFPASHELLPQTNQLYELELAFGEFNALEEEAELAERGAYNGE